jgi:hypothetical protein
LTRTLPLVPRKLLPELEEKIINLIALSTEGLGVKDIYTSFNRDASKRTIQRRLKELENAERIIYQAKSRRYLIFSTTLNSPTSFAREEILLSTAGREIQSLLKTPVARRVLVGYNRTFLDSYVPNKSSYFSKELKAHLFRLGRRGDVEQPAGTYARDIFQRLMIDLSWASSELEGNTYSLLETQKLLEIGEVAEGKDLAETQMIQNHKAAIEYLVDSASDLMVSSFIIRNLHALLSDNLLQNQAACGRLRVTPVGIGGSSYFPLENAQIINECFNQVVRMADAIQDPFEQSFFLMVHLPYLQPFDDVNKRVSRLAANIPLIKNNLCPLSFMDMPKLTYVNGILGIYEFNRTELLRDAFVWSYERSCHRYRVVLQSLGEPDQFRQRYKIQIVSIIRKIIQGCLIPSSECLTTETAAAQIPQEHIDHFIRILDTELRSLHEGNFARYKVRLSEFDLWRREVGSSFFLQD